MGRSRGLFLHRKSLNDDGNCCLKAEMLCIEGQVIVHRVFPPGMIIPLDKLSAAVVKTSDLLPGCFLMGLSSSRTRFNRTSKGATVKT